MSSSKTTSISAFSARFGMAARNGYPTLFSSRSALELVSDFTQTASWSGGSTALLGEIGYFPIGGDPLRAVVRDQGCLEYEVGAAGILRRYEAAGGKNASEVLTIFERMSSGDKPALRVIKETAHLLAGTVAIAAVFSDPQLIVLGGSIGSRPELVDRIAEDAARLIPRPVEIRGSALGNRASMIGAVSMAVTHLHEELFGVTDLSGPLPLPAPEQTSPGEAL